MKKIWGKYMKDSRGIWILLAALTFVLRWLFSINPDFTEVVYSRGLFQLFRVIYDFSLGWLPIPMLYLASLGLLLFLFWKSYKYLRKEASLLARLGRAFVNFLSFVSAVYFLFHLMWGFNYFRVPVEEQMGLEKVQGDTTQLIQEFEFMTRQLIEAREVFDDTNALRLDMLSTSIESEVRSKLEEALSEYGFPVVGRVRGRRLYPEGFLINMGATGIYIPFVLEGHLDGALPAAAVPSTLAHEMAHGYGFGDEGSCNFWAYLACERSEDPVVKYSGRFEYWIYVARQYRKVFPERYRARRKLLPKGVLNDIRLLNETYRKYPGFFPKTSDYVYNEYLKSQGIKEGTLNYSRVVQLVISWRMKEGQ
ncbi:MAG: DUF3810 domain-containing protein [Bacteroidia bacterium]|nr:DUF3810 domain-containing protein [Bacteroidia bacterium]